MANFSERIAEFLRETNMMKFKLGEAVLFADGTLMNNWFNNNRYKIMRPDNDDSDCLLVRKQYEEYKKLTKNSFFMRLGEFILEPNLNKFGAISKVTFRDGTLMGVWYHNNCSKIHALDERVSLELECQKALLNNGIYRLSVTAGLREAAKYVDEELFAHAKHKR